MPFAGGIERTRAQWESLLNSAGLKILEVVNYVKDCEDAVIVAGLNRICHVLSCCNSRPALQFVVRKRCVPLSSKVLR